MNQIHTPAPSDHNLKAKNMDAPPRLPTRQQMDRANTNVALVFDEPREERITPPLEIFVGPLTLMGLMETSITEAAFEKSSVFPLSGFTTFSSASSMSSLADSNMVPMTSGDDEPNTQSLQRLPSRRQSYRKAASPKRGRRKYLTRWASMSPSSPPSRTKTHASSSTEDGPRLPQRRRSHGPDEKEGQFYVSDKKAVMPRKPIRISSSKSLFSERSSGVASRLTQKSGSHASDKEEE
jgi:hypothetical protein